MQLPVLHVEGSDDISIVSNLLLKHGVDTRQGKEKLRISAAGGIHPLLESIPIAIKAATDSPVGFIVDIDINVLDRWRALANLLSGLGITNIPQTCPPQGYIGRYNGYPNCFGVWLMHDCITDESKIEYLIKTLIPNSHPLWPHAEATSDQAKNIIELENRTNGGSWETFHPKDEIKARVYSWLAWQDPPGNSLGAAINSRILGHQSEEVTAFLRWIYGVYKFDALDSI